MRLPQEVSFEVVKSQEHIAYFRKSQAVGYVRFVPYSCVFLIHSHNLLQKAKDIITIVVPLVHV